MSRGTCAPVEVEQGELSAFLLQFSHCKQVVFSLFSAMFFTFLVLFVDDFALKNGPKYSAQVLASVPKQKETGVPNREDMAVR